MTLLLIQVFFPPAGEGLFELTGNLWDRGGRATPVEPWEENLVDAFFNSRVQHGQGEKNP